MELTTTSSIANEPVDHVVLEHPAVEPAAADKPAPNVDTAINALRKRARDHYRNAFRSTLKISDEIDALTAHHGMSISDLKAFLVSECRMNRADVQTYLKLTSALGPQREMLVKKGLPFSVLKALVASPAPVRDQAIALIASGNSVGSADIAILKRKRAEEIAGPAAVQHKKRMKALSAAARNKALERVTDFRKAFHPFGAELISFYNDGCERQLPSEEYESRTAWIVEQAGMCLRQFEELFDVSSLPPSYEFHLDIHPDDQVMLARAHYSLRELAAGDLQAVDPESFNPLNKEDNYIDRWYIEQIIWLLDDVDVAADSLKQSQKPAPVRLDQPPYRLRSLEICTGAGGQAIGLHAAGFDALGLYEMNPHAVATLRANGGLGPVHQADVRKVDFRKYRGHVDLLAGGVPCQPFSAMGKQQGRNDKRDLFLETVRIVDEVQPRAFFFENVHRFDHVKAASYRAELHRHFKELGYETQIFTFEGTDYGLAQWRPRVAFVGFRDGLMSRFEMAPKFKDEWRTTVGEALLDLVSADGWEGAEEWAREKANKIGPTIVGGSEHSGGLAFTSNQQMDEWLGLGIDPMGFADRPPQPGHKGLFKFTLAMGARLQGFPDDWQFKAIGKQQNQHGKRQIANALPPIMARAVGLSVYAALTGVKFDYATALRLPLLEPRPTEAKGLFSDLNRQDFLWQDEHPDIPPAW